MATDRVPTTRTNPRTVTNAARVAGGLVILLGAANVVLGVISLVTDLIRLSGAAGGWLVALGVVTAAVGVLVGRGVEPALWGATLVLGGLLLLDVSVLLSDGAGGGVGARVAVLGVTTAALIAALVARPRGRAARRR